jgi:UDP-N-acetyl-D-glucosamine dehydrogenase
VNGAMPHHVVDKVADALNSHSKSIRGSNVLMLGIAYKRDVDDIRESPALDILGVLEQKGARVSYHDPYAPHLAGREWPGARDLQSVPLTPETLAAADCIVIITDHKVFDYDTIVRHAKLVVDSRNAIKGRHRNVYKLGAPGGAAGL